MAQRVRKMTEVFGSTLEHNRVVSHVATIITAQLDKTKKHLTEGRKHAMFVYQSVVKGVQLASSHILDTVKALVSLLNERFKLGVDISSISIPVSQVLWCLCDILCRM